MIKEINTGKAELLLWSPDSYFIYPAGIVGREFYYWTTANAQNMGDYPQSKQLPEGSWEFLGLSTELTEEQCKEVVYKMTITGNLFKHYTNLSFWCGTAKTSFKSLTQAHDCTDETWLVLKRL